MKFLVIARPRENRQGMTSAMVEATLEKVKGQLKIGVFDCLYSFADGSGSVPIANADSGEALIEALESPTQPFIHFEAKPLGAFERRINNLTAMKKQGL
jgi:hypothetical protein